MRGFRGHVWKRSSRQVLDTDLLAVQPLDRSDVGIPDSSDCHLPLPSLGLERDRHELDAEHFGDRSGLRRKRTARLEGEDRAQCLTLRRVGALVDVERPPPIAFRHVAWREVHSHHVQSIERHVAFPAGFDMVAEKDRTQAGGRGISDDARAHCLAIAGFHVEALDIPRALLLRRLRNSDGAQRAEDGRSSYRASNVEQTATGEWCHRNLPTCTDKTF